MMWLAKVAAFAVTFATLGALLFSRDVRSWVAERGLVFYSATLVLLAAVVVLAELLWRARRNRQVRPTEWDVKLFKRIEDVLPSDRGDILYLREHFHGHKWDRDRLRSLESYARDWGNAVHFVDKKVEKAHRRLVNTARRFVDNAMDQEYDMQNGQHNLAVIEEASNIKGASSGRDATRRPSEANVRAVVREHAALMKVGHSRGL